MKAFAPLAKTSSPRSRRETAAIRRKLNFRNIFRRWKGEISGVSIRCPLSCACKIEILAFSECQEHFTKLQIECFSFEINPLLKFHHVLIINYILNFTLLNLDVCSKNFFFSFQQIIIVGV